MHKRSALPRLAAALAVGVACLAGCAGGPATPRLPAGPVAIVAAGFAPRPAVDVLAQGKAAAAGKIGAGSAAEGAAAGALAPLQMGPLGIAAYPLIAPFTILAGTLIGGTVGTGYGLINGLPGNEVADIRSVSERAMAQLAVQEQIPRRLEARLRRAGEAVSYLPAAGPATLRENADYDLVLARGYGGVLELAVISVGMVPTKGEPRRIAFVMKLRTRIDCQGACAAGERIFEYRSRPQVIEAWSRDAGALLQQEFELAYRHLEQCAVEVHFPGALQRESQLAGER